MPSNAASPFRARLRSLPALAGRSCVDPQSGAFAVCGMTVRPLILTCAFDAVSFAHFDAMRRRHFPRARNLIPAHLTLFHHLPGDRETAIIEVLRDVAAAQPSICIGVTGLRFLGHGSAYSVESQRLDRLRVSLAARWSDRLTRQDAQRFRPHVTIQNKVPAERAKAVYAELCAAFEPFTATATGLSLWRYLDGPWALIETVEFAPGAR